MSEKIYDIVFESHGWTCRTEGQMVGSWPSWLLALGAARAAAERDRMLGLSPVIRYQDLKGGMHRLELQSETELPAYSELANRRGRTAQQGRIRPN